MALESILGGKKLQSIKDLLLSISGLPGDIAELGVYKGGTAEYMHDLVPSKTLWLFDTFKGMPHKDDIDFHEVGSFSDLDFDKIKEAFAGKPVHICAGKFPETAPTGEIQFCFVHLDADQYQVTKQGLEYFFPRLVPGGIIILDDYEWKYCQGVEKAVSEFLKTVTCKFSLGAKFQCVLTK